MNFDFLENCPMPDSRRRYYAGLLNALAKDQNDIESTSNAGLRIITAANEKYINTTITLLRSLRGVSGVEFVIMFDLGLSPESRKMLRQITSPKIFITDILLPLVNKPYLETYQFKLDALFLGPLLCKEISRNQDWLWLDAGVLVNGSLTQTISSLKRRDFFLCDLSTRPFRGKSGTTIRLFNHLAPYDGKLGDFPFEIQIICKPILWAGILGFRTGTVFFKRCILKAFEISLLRPDLIGGPKFSDSVTAKRMEADPVFKEAVDFSDRNGLELASRTWNGARHDLFLLTCLFHEANYSALDSTGLIEDITDGRQSKKNLEATTPINSDREFSLELLKDPKSEFVIHRGTVRIAS